MKTIYALIFTLFAVLPLSTNAQRSRQASSNYALAERFSPDKIRNMVFSTRVDPHWLKESNRFWYVYKTNNGERHIIVDPVRKTKQALFDNAKMAADMSRLTGDPFDALHLNISKLKFINNEKVLQFEVKSVLLEEEEKVEGDSQDDKKKSKKKPKMVPKVWYFQYTLATRTLRLMEDYEKPEEDKDWANMAPNGEYVVYSKGHNIWWMDKANYEKAKKDDKDSTIVENQWTTDGEEYFSYGGRGRGVTNVDKEKNKDKRESVGVLWSPNSKKFAMTRSDSRHVKDLWVINSVAEPRPTLESYKYQMPGEKESPVTDLLVFDFDAKSQIEMQSDTFPDQTISINSAPQLKSTRDDDHRPRLWLSKSNDQVYFTRTSRDLKRIDICVANATTGEVKVLVEERLNTYVETRTPGLVNNGSELIHWSERDGWAHFYLYDGNGNVKNQITSGAYHCQSIEGIDENNRVLYFTANGKEGNEDPYYYHLYKINFNGSGLKLLNSGNYDNAVSLNDQSSFFVNNYSRVNTTPQSDLFNGLGTKVMSLETADLSKLFEAGYQFPEPYKLKAGDGITDLYGVMYKPFDFDSTKKYPLIEYVYPGPQTEAVNKSFSARMDRLDRLAQLGFIVVSVGNRGGHPARSKWYHNYGYGNLRDYGLEDKKVAAEQLSYRYDFIDINKVGIFGHSGGAFMSTAAMLVYPDFFRVAVSSSGNHENNVYNRWWSEKHHGVKEVVSDSGKVTFEYDIEKNPDLAKNLKGKLMITTGDIDNNVHPAGTIRMANALIKANKRFDFFLFPGQRHGYGNMNEYFFWLKADYFTEHLIGYKKRGADFTEINRGKALTR